MPPRPRVSAASSRGVAGGSPLCAGRIDDIGVIGARQSRGPNPGNRANPWGALDASAPVPVGGGAGRRLCVSEAERRAGGFAQTGSGWPYSAGPHGPSWARDAARPGPTLTPGPPVWSALAPGSATAHRGSRHPRASRSPSVPSRRSPRSTRSRTRLRGSGCGGGCRAATSRPRPAQRPGWRSRASPTLCGRLRVEPT